MAYFTGIFETLKRIKYRRPQPKFCPICKSYRIYPISSLGILPPKFTCRDCGYEGILILELENEDDASTVTK